MEQRIQLEQKHYELSQKVAAIKMKRQEEEPTVKKYKEINNSLTNELREFKKIQNSSTQQINDAKNAKADLSEKMVPLSF